MSTDLQKNTIGFWQSKINITSIIGAFITFLPLLVEYSTVTLEILQVLDSHYTLSQPLQDLTTYIGIFLFITQAILRTKEKGHKDVN